MTPYTLAEAIGFVAPYYNLGFVIIVIILFGFMFKSAKKNFYVVPWHILFASLIIFVFEEIITVLDTSGIIAAPNVLFPILEMVIITLFIYLLLLQKDYISRL